ncbi:hypothetical protein AAFP32_01345 [Brevibacterium sp. CBA3109]|uniref:Uncharacterized protein n=1 Tax=Brevibacterium koreense TaxID=3140787 RepID=A0AAU7UKN5_9MICO
MPIIVPVFDIGFAGVWRGCAGTDPDLVAHHIDAGDLCAQVQCPTCGADIGGQRLGQGNEVGDGGVR